MRRTCLSTFSSHALVCGLVVLVSGCYESFTRPLDVILRDAGGASLEAGLPIEIPPGDSGPRRDAGVDASPDAGVLDPRCGGEQVEPYLGVGCSAETRACLDGCVDSGCVEACYADDPECPRCINQTLVRCANQLGCQTAWDAFACCTDWSCPEAGEGVERFGCMALGDCARELQAYADCLDGEVFRACEARLAACSP